MSDPAARADVHPELTSLTSEFFRAVSFESGHSPSYERIHGLFIDSGLLIKNSGMSPEICTVPQFIESRKAMVSSGELTRFHEAEISSKIEIFGNVAQQFMSYAKSGTLKGVSFEARGMISTQFVRTPVGWRISSMAWDDERLGVSLPDSWQAPQS
jgi:hypothetical protein